ncbi:metallophosphoesterase family protein [Ruegeria sp. R14_0]|uniref:metallophosphoesterase family protein n=1 Tax=Ruegeria sp. R14_0 TaxID=2821100 RepID=UPI001ADCEAA4|nr:metallophosphoesterase family protein [Ruegeria sp. R14_0]MBO9446385.1 serine/threonine protein phosphatase [Ruegeria sp. R14_0]
MSEPIYAIGDIHGQLDMLQDALARIERDGGPDAKVVFIGDYTDRGAHSRDVLDLLIQGQAEGKNWTFLRGNHDQMYAMFLEDYPRNDARLLVGYHWLHPRIGGVETLKSYGVEVEDGDRIYQVHAQAKQVVPQAHLDFMSNLQSFHLTGDVLLVHAGIRPGIPLDQQDRDDLIWIRGEFLDHEGEYPWLIVHGHSHVPAPEHHGNRVNIDTGAGYGHALTAVVLEGTQCWTLDAQGRKLLAP